MAFTCKHINQTELQSLIDSGEVERLYEDSKEHIENGNYVYNSGSEISDEEKLDHWKSLMTSFASGKVVDKDTFTYYCLATYKDDVLCMMSATYFDSADNSYNYTHALLGKIDGSKAYAFSTDFFAPQSTLMKSVGADKMVFYSVKGGSLSFRSLTAQGSPGLFDYDQLSQEEVKDEYEVDNPDIEVAETMDGSTKTDDAKEKIKISREEIKTVRILR